MRRLTLSGVAPGDAARIAVSTDGEFPEVSGPPHLTIASEPQPPAASTRRLTPEDEIVIAREGRAAYAAANGRVLPSRPSLAIAPTPDALVDASFAFDMLSCLAIIRATLERLGPAEGWAHVIAPAFDVIRSEHTLGTPGQDPAVMTAAACHAALRDTAPADELINFDAPPILLSGAARGSDQLGAHFFALALQLGALDQPGSEGRAPRVLVHSHDFAVRSLDPVMERTDAQAVVLIASMPPADEGIVERFIKSGNGVELFLVGAGWAPQDAGENRTVMRTYAGAVYEVLAEIYSRA